METKTETETEKEVYLPTDGQEWITTFHFKEN